MTFHISINPLISSDNTINITSDVYNPVTNPSGTSIYALEKMKLTYSIVSSSTPGYLYLSTTGLITNNNKIKEGQIIIIYKIIDNIQSPEVIFIGFIRSIIYDIGESGSFITVILDSLLSQLIQLPMIQNSQQQEYYNVLLQGVTGAQIAPGDLWNGIINGSILQKASTLLPTYSDLPYKPFCIINGTTVLPDLVWANVQLNQSRDSVLREILLPYNRLLFQDSEGIIRVQPIFKNDTSTDWNIAIGSSGVYANDSNKAKYQHIRIINNAAGITNQITELFAIPFYGQMPEGLSNSLQASALPNPLYYKRVNELNQSGYFNTGILENKCVNSNMLTDTTLLTYINSWANNSSLIGADGNKYAMPQLYAQNAMANMLTSAINVDILYNWNSVMNYNIPLAQIINITSNQSILDYPNLICYGAEINFNTDNKGTFLTLNLSGVGSITGIWDEL